MAKERSRAGARLRRRAGASIAALLTLVVVVARGGGARQHDCVHSTHITPILEQRAKAYGEKGRFFKTHTADEQKTNRKILQSGDAHPLRVHVEYQLDGVESSLETFLRTSLVPAAVSQLSSFLSVKVPTDGTLHLSRECGSTWDVDPYLCYSINPVGKCLVANHNASFFGAYKTCTAHTEDTCTLFPAQEGLANKDLAIYVTAEQTSSCGNKTIAYAGWCELDTQSKRPLAGNVNFCPSMTKTASDSFGEMLDTSIHELLHVLAFSESLYAFFLNDDSSPRGLENTIATAGDRKSVISSKTVEAARAHFNCSTLSEVHLENEGSATTAFSHWEELHMFGEVMTGVQHDRGVLSNITLSFLEDTGWYNVDYSKAGFLEHGYGEGCTFSSDTCPQLLEDFPRYYCNSSQSGNQCSTSYNALSYCHYSNLGDTCRAKKDYDNGVCSDDANHNPARVKFGEVYGANSRCFPVASDNIEVQVDQLIYTSSLSGAGCFKASCEKEEGNNVLYVGIGEKYTKCPEGEYLEYSSIDSKYTSGRIGPCPNPDHVCPYFGCPNDCSNNGICYDQKCHCNIGYHGTDCSVKETYTSDTPSDADPGENESTNVPVEGEESVVQSFTCFDGYLSNCTLFIDVNGNGKFDTGVDISNVTSTNGVASLEHKYEGQDLSVLVFGIDPPFYSDCTDSFTNWTIPFPFESHLSSSVVSPLTTVASRMMKRYGLTRQRATERVNTLADLSPSTDVFTYDAIKAVRVKYGNRNGFSYTSEIVSMVQILARFYRPLLDVDSSQSAASHVIDAYVDVVYSTRPNFYFGSEEDIRNLVSALSDNLPNTDISVEQEALQLLIDMLKSVKKLYEDAAAEEIEEEDYLEKAASISVFALTDVVFAMDPISYSAVNSDAFSAAQTMIDTLAVNSASLLEPIYIRDPTSDEENDEVHGEEPIIETDRIPVQQEETIVDKMRYIVDDAIAFIRKYEIAFIIGGVVVSLGIGQMARRRAARNAQNVSPLYED